MSLPELKMDINLRKLNSHCNMESELLLNRKIMYNWTKRLLDVLGASFGIVLLFPLFIITAFLIQWEDPNGKILYKQIRIGKNGKPFMMYKFRSMISNADELLEELMHLNESNGAMFKIKDDPRITRVGKFIRKTSIDELPQLWNVLRGEMSLVGPRPPLPREVNEYTDFDKLRLLVTPGCTGLWQISGRSQLGFNEMVELDVLYIKNRNILMDIKIIFKTFRVLTGSKDAY